ncbi:MAG: amidinotransferase [Candidatus Nanopelagicales bacterium]
MASEQVRVDYEWDRLRSAVVGYPRIRLGRRIPRLAANYMPAPVLAMARAVLDQHRDQDLSEAMPELHEIAVAQMAAAIDILRSRGVQVHQVAPIDPAEEALFADLGEGNTMQYFPRDPIVVIGDKVIEAALRSPARRSERFAIRRTIADLVPANSSVAIPEPMPIPEGEDISFGPGPFLEGGDVFVLGRDIYVGLTGNASNAAGAAALRGVLGDDYRVHEVPLSSSFLHLDCVLSTLREGLALVCREGFADGLPTFLEGWELIDISPADAEARLATNVLVLDPATVLVAEETPEVAEALDRVGQTVITTPFSAVFLWGGAFRCWHHPLVRG